MTTEFSGSALVLSWVHPSGTVTLGADYRTFSTAPSIGMVQTTAGSDADHTYLVTVKDGAYSFSGVAQNSGTVLENALVEGTFGTLIIGREGTVAGKPKETVPAFSKGATFALKYDDVTEITCEWQKSGARVLSVYP
jgi:hypothetical protein